MSDTSIETVTDDEFGVVAFVHKLHVAAKAGRVLLDTIEALDLGDDVLDATRKARAAYDRLDAEQAART